MKTLRGCWRRRICLLLCLGGCFPLAGPPPPNWSTDTGEALRARLNGPGARSTILVGGGHITASLSLSRFYARRGYRPAWSGPRGPLPRAAGLLRVVRRAAQDGLRPQDYRAEDIGRALREARAGAPGASAGVSVVDLDILLTDAFLRCARDLHRGRVRPRDIHPEWQVASPEIDLVGLLQTALDLGRVEQTLDALRPAQEGYADLRQVLARYRHVAAAGGWPRVSTGPGERESLRRRLAATGDLRLGPGAAANLSDAALVRALGDFQRRHGLPESARVDPATRQALNTSVEQRIAQVELNMERWRWLPHHPGTRYILVRIGDFELDVVEDGRPALSMRIIAGKPYWRTPVFSCPMTHLVFNPSWHVPRSIAAEEILPALRRDPGYLDRRQMRVVVAQGDTTTAVEVDSIDWSAVAPDSLAFSFVQLPGAGNPLGRVKFALPNPFDVYLHDTPDAALFARPERGFSHGCIRLEKSLDLAAYVLRPNPTWSRVRIGTVAESGQTLEVYLPEPVPVYLLYWTAWVEESGEVQFRGDPYESDRRLRQALVRARPQ